MLKAPLFFKSADILTEWDFNSGPTMEEKKLIKIKKKRKIFEYFVTGQFMAILRVGYHFPFFNL